MSGVEPWTEHFPKRVNVPNSEWQEKMVPNARTGPLPRPVAESAALLARDALTSPMQIPES